MELSTVVRKEGDLFSLTDVWKNAGSPASKDPREWLRFESTKQLIETVSGMLNVGEIHIIKTQRGRGKMQGTWAQKQLMLAYAKYLDPRLHVAVNQVYFERIEEINNPDLAMRRGQERARRAWAKMGRDEAWIEARINGVSTRVAFTATLSYHGVNKGGYRNCTNAIYSPLYGGTTDVIRMKKSLTGKQSIRDNMTPTELIAVQLAEQLAKEKIKSDNLYGNAQCELACTQAAKHVAKAIMANKQQRIR